MRYLTNLDMNQNELENAVFQNSSVAPKNPKVGQIYTDTSGSENKLMWWNGVKWVALGATTPEKTPTKKDPSVSITVSGMDSANVEVGTNIPINYKAEFNPGSYTYGPDTGVTATAWRVYSSDDPSSIMSTPTGTLAEVTVGDDTDYAIKVEVDHTEGAIPVTDQGSPYPEAKIAAGTKTASTSGVAGFRKYFYGTLTDISDITSDVIRSLTHSTSPVGDSASFDLPIAKGANRVIIAFPSDLGMSLTSVIDTKAFNIEVNDIFSLTKVDVEGANGYRAISYDAYVYTPDISLNANTYKVTISK